MPLINRPERAYTIALLVLAFFFLVAVGDLMFLKRSPAIGESSRWVLELVAFIEGLYVLAIAITLALRGWAPAAGRVATVALNIILLLMFPFGTAVGAFGLWKVDKPRRSTVA